MKTTAPRPLQPPPSGPVTYDELLKMMALESMGCDEWLKFYANDPAVDHIAAHWRRRKARADQLCRVLRLILDNPALKDEIAAAHAAETKRAAEIVNRVEADASPADDAADAEQGAEQ